MIQMKRLYPVALAALLMTNPIDSYSQIQNVQDHQPQKIESIEDIVKDNTDAKHVRDNFSVHRNVVGTNDVPFDIYAIIATNYVLSADLARVLTRSTYELKHVKDHTYQLTSIKGLDADMEVLDEYVTKDKIRTVYLFDGTSKDTFKGDFEALFSLTTQRSKEGKISYSAEYWARPKGGKIKSFFAKWFINIFSLGDDIDKRVMDITGVAEKTTARILLDPRGAVYQLIHNDKGIKFDYRQIFELKTIIDDYNRTNSPSYMGQLNSIKLN